MQQLQVNRQGAVKIKSACIQKHFLQRNDISGATGLHQVAEGDHHTATLSALLWGAAMQPCSAVSGWQHSKPTSLPTASRTWEGELKYFLIISLSQYFTEINEVTDSSLFQRPPFFARVADNFKSFSISLGGGNQQKLVLLRLFWQRNDTQFPCQGHGKEGKYSKTTEFAKQLFGRPTKGFQKQWKPTQ